MKGMGYSGTSQRKNYTVGECRSMGRGALYDRIQDEQVREDMTKSNPFVLGLWRRTT